MNEPTPQPSAKKPEGLGKYLALASVGCLVVLGIIGAIVFFVFRLTAGPLDVVNEHLQALAAGDIQKAYTFCSTAFQENTTFPDFENFVNSYSILKNAEVFSSTNRQITGNEAVLKGTLKGKDGSSLPAEYRLVKESDVWKIFYINLSAAGTPSDSDATDTSGQQQPAGDSPLQQPEQPETVSPSQLSIQDLSVNKQMSGDLITVKIGFRVVNFGQDKSGGLARVHIVQDLQTFDPSGNMIPQLSAEAIKEVQESKLPHYDYADFSNTLNIPATYPPGTYTARLIVNDRIGNVSTFTTANFEIP